MIRVAKMTLLNDTRRQHVIIDEVITITLPAGIFVSVRDEGDDVVATLKTTMGEYEVACPRVNVNSAAFTASMKA